MSVPALLAAAILLLLLSGLAAVLSAMLDRPSPIRLRHWAEESGGRLLKLYERPARFEAFRYLLAAQAILLPAAMFAAILLAVVFSQASVTHSVLTAAALTAIAAGLVELGNRFLVSRNPEKVLRRLTRVYRVALVVLGPLVVLVAPLLPAAIERQEDEEEDEASEEEIEAFLDVGAKEGILEPGEEDLILRVIDFGDERVKSVMMPRIDMVCAPVGADLKTLAELFVESRHSRIPLYDESVDNIRGVLHIRDLLRGLRAADPPPAGALAMPPIFVPETKPLGDLLQELQAAHQQMAIVVDEYGGTAGLVTVEDLLEEIVGEIVDEHDLEEPETEKLENGGWRLGGMASLDTLEEIFGLDLEDEPYETVGGLIFGRLGNVPKPGVVVEAHGLVFQVENVVDRRIERLVVKPSKAASDSGNQTEPASHGQAKDAADAAAERPGDSA